MIVAGKMIQKNSLQSKNSKQFIILVLLFKHFTHASYSIEFFYTILQHFVDGVFFWQYYFFLLLLFYSSLIDIPRRIINVVFKNDMKFEKFL